MTLNFGGRQMAHVHVSWLDPHKIRRITIVGSQRMAVFDDLESTEKLRIYDKGAAVNTDYNTFAEYVGLRFGDITIPYIRGGEPLAPRVPALLALRARARAAAQRRPGRPARDQGARGGREVAGGERRSSVHRVRLGNP